MHIPQFKCQCSIVILLSQLTNAMRCALFQSQIYFKLWSETDLKLRKKKKEMCCNLLCNENLFKVKHLYCNHMCVDKLQLLNIVLAIIIYSMRNQLYSVQKSCTV